MFRKKRNISEYLRDGEVSEQEVTEIIAPAKKLRTQVKNWIRAKVDEGN